MRVRIQFVALLFALAALVGPILLWMRSFIQSGVSRNPFVADLVFLLWPMQPLAVVEASIGTFCAAIVAIGGNVLLFAGIGMFAGAISRDPRRLLILYLVVGALVVLFALWGAGFSLIYVNVSALVVALLFYALVFWLTPRVAR